jgi:16S rRNA (guanine966-N2)-methyltransferase
MRITGGEVKGRVLVSPKGLGIRPTSDPVREAIFDILGHLLEGIAVLDLFAGTGSLGLESLSRGASCALFVDHSPQAMRMLQKNLKRCGYEEKGAVLKWDLRKGLPVNHRWLKKGLGLVFLDPPYEKGFIPPLLEDLSLCGLLLSRSQVVAETRKTEVLPQRVHGLCLVNTRYYGDTQITRYEFEV